jgi:tetratricopeptide (TPR) repeat protein
MKGAWIALVLVCIGTLLALAFPYIASAYHLEAGGRALERLDPAAPDRTTALGHLERSIHWSPDNAQAYRLLAKVYRAQGEWSAAAAALERFTTLQPGNPLGYIELAQLYEEIEEQGAQAVVASTNLDAAWKEAWRRAGLAADEFLAQGERARKAGLYEEAMHWYRRAQRLEPGWGDAWYFMGLAYEEQAQWEPALAAYAQAVTLDSYRQVASSIPLYRMGTIYQRQLVPPQLDKAFSAYQAALALDDFRSTQDAARAHARLGQVYYALHNDMATAIAEMQKALTLAPDDKWLPYMLGELYRREGRLAEAREAYEQALQLDPEFDEVKNRLKSLPGGE